MGQKKPFTIEEARRLKDLLRAAGRCRDLALASVAFDSALRCCDVLALQWDRNLDAPGSVKGRVTIRQQKTGENVTFELSAKTRVALENLAAEGGTEGFVFPGSTPDTPLR